MSDFIELAKEFKDWNLETQGGLEVKNACALEKIHSFLGKEKDEHKRAMLLEAFGGTSAEPAIVLLLSEILSTDKSAVVRRAAAEALFEVGDSTACANLLSAVDNDSDIQVRVSAALALAVIEDPSEKKTLAAALEDDSNEIRLALKAAIENSGYNNHSK